MPTFFARTCHGEDSDRRDKKATLVSSTLVILPAFSRKLAAEFEDITTFWKG